MNLAPRRREIWKQRTLLFTSILKGRLTRTDQISSLDASLAEPIPEVSGSFHQVRGVPLDRTNAGGEAAVGTVLGDDVLRRGSGMLRGGQLRQDVGLYVGRTEGT